MMVKIYRIKHIRLVLNNKTFEVVLADKPQCRNCKIHNNHPALALVVLRSLYTYRSTGKLLLALFLLSQNHNWDK
jgi:hypothetical protein